MKRRTFLKTSAGALTLPVVLNGMRLNAWADTSLLTADTDRVLVIIQLEGGNDGLNTVIPVDDAEYYNARPTLKIDKDTALTIDNNPLLRLHPSLQGIQQMFNEGNLAVVQNIGYEQYTLSHFEGTEIWNTASGGRALKDRLPTGWLGRYLQTEYPEYPDTLPDDPPAIQINLSTSSAFIGNKGSISIALTDPDEFYGLVTGGTQVSDDNAPDTLSGREWNFINSIGKQSTDFAQSIKHAYGLAANIADYPSNSLANALKIVARLIAGGLKTRIYKVSLGGFDTHYSQLPTHTQLLSILSTAVKAFYDDCNKLNIADRVVGMTYSEFGRRVHDSGTGSDHGTAAPHFVFGSTINGGKVFGGLPDLVNLIDDGNLQYSLNFQCYYASVMAPLFGVSDAALKKIFPFGLCERKDYVPLYNRSSVHGGSASSINPVFLRDGDVTAVRYTANGRERIHLALYDLTGRELIRLADREVAAGTHLFRVQESELPSGTFLLQLQTPVTQATHKLVIVR